METNSNICGRIFGAALLISVATAPGSTAFGYGNEGHQTVGVVADKLIANSPNTVAHVRALIGNETLEHASTWTADCKYLFNLSLPDMRDFVYATTHVHSDIGTY